MTQPHVRVLVADGDPTVREVLRLTLDVDGCEVVTARDGAEAVDVAGEIHPDIAFLDISMSHLDGLEVCRRLKAAPEPPRVVMVSAGSGFEDEHAAVLAGADGYLHKPFSPLELLSIVNTEETATRR